MTIRLRTCPIALVVAAWTASSACAHYHILLPDAPSAESTVALLLRFGHPYEHEIIDAAKPERLVAIVPGGPVRDLTDQLRKESHKEGADGQAVDVYAASFKFDKRGDHVFVAQAPPIWMKEEGRFFKDTVRVVVHHGSQIGWDATLGKGFEIAPLTRPYGLRPGMVFQAQVLSDGTAAGGVFVEIERYNETRPKVLPDDEHITRLVKTGPEGVATGTLTDPGWWCLTARRINGERAHDGKMHPVLERTTLWVHVDGIARVPPPK
jgi:cobalt/nickel transport protein